MPPAKKKSSAKRRLDFEATSGQNRSRQSAKVASTSNVPATKPITSLLSSPAKRARPSKAIVTPDVAKHEREDEYVPKYIHKNVEYQRRGRKSLPSTKLAAFDQIMQHYVIPKDLEQSRKYGPLSGSSYEELVLQAYTLDKLEPMEAQVEICTECAKIGHKRYECPKLI